MIKVSVDPGKIGHRIADIGPGGVERNVRAFTYWKGDKAEYTGQTEELYGGVFYEIRMLEGHQVGQLKLTASAPAK